ncbi:unnamed protein product [Paramecium sonneborni]|uniref:Uncharacterized protein n=1 Tax=Paramecium sonneborni TaxID=65129 RepID=A0A8S1QEJ4_9CILI|nr:unnamed protein product [Paramecium sonneborni]
MKNRSQKSSNLLKIYSKTNEIDEKKDKEQKQIQNKSYKQQQVEYEMELIQYCNQILQDLENQSFFEQNSIANHFLYLDNQIRNEKKVNYTIQFDANFIVAAFQLAFDFYKIFVDFYHTQQIQKCKELGQIINQESFEIYLYYFCTYLAVKIL